MIPKTLKPLGTSQLSLWAKYKDDRPALMAAFENAGFDVSPLLVVETSVSTGMVVVPADAAPGVPAPKKRGPKPKFGVPMTGSERVARWRANKKSKTPT